MKPDLAGNVPHCTFHLANVRVGLRCSGRPRARWGARVSLARLKQELLDPGAAGELTAQSCAFRKFIDSLFRIVLKNNCCNARGI